MPIQMQMQIWIELQLQMQIVTVTDVDTDADTGIFTNTNIVTNRLTENYMPLRYDGMLHVIRYASSGMLLLVFGANSLYMYRYGC